MAQGIVDILGSDHAPHTLEEKAKPYPQSPSGMTGRADARADHARSCERRAAQPARFVDLTSAGPARLFGIAGKGRVAVGYDADLTIVDLKKKVTITDAMMASRVAWTPYAGQDVTGWPIGTIVRGRRVMFEGELVTPAIGEVVRFTDTRLS